MIVPSAEAVALQTLKDDSNWRDGHWRAAHYQRLHADAIERECILKSRVATLEDLATRHQSQIVEQAQRIETLIAQNAWLKQQLFGQKAEDCPDNSLAGNAVSGVPKEGKKKRGQQPGSRGHGRRNQTHPRLEIEEIEHDLPEDKRVCPRCRLSFVEFPGTEDSEEVHWEVRIIRRVHKRKRYKPTCTCGAVPGIVTAPPPPKLIPKGKFSSDFWARMLLEKFLLQRPVQRSVLALTLEGLGVAPGTIAGGFERIDLLLEPVYSAIVAHSHLAHLRKMDETRWLVFVPREDKEGYRWWMWIDVTPETVVYILDPTRSAQVLRKYLGPWEGFLLVDCYSAYKAHQTWASRLGITILLAFCWAHRRRDFIEIGDGYPRLRLWAEGWVARINEVFHINNQRVDAAAFSPAFQEHDQKLRQALAAMENIRDRELADPQLRPVQKHVLACLHRHWEGLMRFVDHPEIPMDNNESERLQRPEALGRKNYYGSGSLWSGQFSAHAFTIIQTLRQNGLDPQQWFFAYFKACAENCGKVPASINPWLPWNLSQEQKTAWRLPWHPP